MKTLYSIFFLLFAITASFAQKSLTLNLVQGREYRQSSNVKATITQSFGGQEMTINMTVKATMVYQVKGVNANSYNMDVRYENMTMEMVMPQATMKFSSENPGESDMVSQALAGMTKTFFQVEMAKNGKVNSVKNMDKVFAAAFEKFTQVSPEQKEQIKAQLSQSYGDKAIANSIETVTAIFPDKPVKVNDTWTISTGLSTAMAEATISTTYKFVEEKPEYRKIHGDSKITAVKKDEYTMTNGMEMKFDMEGTMTSDIKVDKTSGWILEANVVQNLNGTAHVKGNDQMPQGMTIPMKIKTEVLNTGN